MEAPGLFGLGDGSGRIRFDEEQSKLKVATAYIELVFGDPGYSSQKSRLLFQSFAKRFFSLGRGGFAESLGKGDLRKRQLHPVGGQARETTAERFQKPRRFLV